MSESEIIRLWNERKIEPRKTSEESFQPFLELFLLSTGTPRGIVIIFPGGAYTHRAYHEGVPVAERFNRLGFHAAVVHHRVSPYVWPVPQEDAHRAIKIIRANAEKWAVKPDKTAVLGFSVGGNLAGCTAAYYDTVRADAGDSADAYSARPDATILCYPVITPLPAESAYRDSFYTLLGTKDLPDVKAEKYALDRLVNDKSPPAFLWHTAADNGVPVYNSLVYASALSRHKISFELHIYPRGGHGLGLGTDDSVPELRNWPDLCGAWLSRMDW